MGLADLLAVLLAGQHSGSGSTASRPKETNFYECRRCGTTVDSTTECCPTCGTKEIAEYVLE